MIEDFVGTNRNKPLGREGFLLVYYIIMNAPLVWFSKSTKSCGFRESSESGEFSESR